MPLVNTHGEAELIFSFTQSSRNNAAVVLGQGGLLGEIFAVKGRGKPEPGKRLEAVADTDHQLAVAHELFEVVAQPELDPVGKHRARAEVVAERESRR